MSQGPTTTLRGNQVGAYSFFRVLDSAHGDAFFRPQLSSVERALTGSNRCSVTHRAARKQFRHNMWPSRRRYRGRAVSFSQLFGLKLSLIAFVPRRLLTSLQLPCPQVVLKAVLESRCTLRDTRASTRVLPTDIGELAAGQSLTVD